MISRMSPAASVRRYVCAQSDGGCAAGVYATSAAPVRCVAAFHRVVLRWLVDGTGETGRARDGEQIRGEEGEGGTQPAEREARGRRVDRGGFNEPI